MSGPRPDREVTPRDAAALDGGVDVSASDAGAPLDAQIADATSTDASVLDAGAGGRDAGLEPDSGDAGGINGCWMTHTKSGDTRLDLQESGGRVTGTQSWDGYVYTVRMGTLGASGLTFTVDWTDFEYSCLHTFDVVGPTFMSGMVDCAGNVWAMTVDRTCP